MHGQVAYKWTPLIQVSVTGDITRVTESNTSENLNLPSLHLEKKKKVKDLKRTIKIIFCFI